MKQRLFYSVWILWLVLMLIGCAGSLRAQPRYNAAPYDLGAKTWVRVKDDISFHFAIESDRYGIGFVMAQDDWLWKGASVYDFDLRTLTIVNSDPDATAICASADAKIVGGYYNRGGGWLFLKGRLITVPGPVAGISESGRYIVGNQGLNIYRWDRVTDDVIYISQAIAGDVDDAGNILGASYLYGDWQAGFWVDQSFYNLNALVWDTGGQRYIVGKQFLGGGRIRCSADSFDNPDGWQVDYLLTPRPFFAAKPVRR